MFCLRQIFFILKISTFLILLFITLSGSAAHSADVVLTWDRPNDIRVIGYKIYYGLVAADFKSTPEEIIHSPDQTSCNIYDLKTGDTYGFAAKSFDKKGNESNFSEVLYYDPPAMQDKSSIGGGGGGGGCFLRMISDLSIPKH